MDSIGEGGARRPHSISVVIPVYQGERTLAALLTELEPLMQDVLSPDGHRLRVTEILLVHDNGPDGSAAVLRDLAERYDVVRPLWLSRNFGQHPATLAGMASSGGDWIVTMDEDGQHDPASIPAMLDVAMAARADVVYARPTNRPPHGVLRNIGSRMSKRLLRLSTSGTDATEYQSLRLVLGEVGRSVAAYAGAGVYLDVALSWVAQKVTTCPVELRDEGGRPSGYSVRTLFSHFWRMVLSSGTRALRLVSLLGLVVAVGGLLLAVYFIASSLFWKVDLPPGWPSLMVVLLVCSGAILFSLGVIAEYVGVAVKMAMGRPLYLIVSDPQSGPLGRPVDTSPGSPATRSRRPDEPAAGERALRSTVGNDSSHPVP
ncbi:glycosyltransferase [Nakamurella sp. PAMC28650]|uniref:glycosyltransferase n=1 Tax=Nakamurella sp. PAMC28650 TaxID=2762325 RepID=UPI00164DD3FF|nr:glycosyltransferase [Nakamurella sp. PAMC28650]QNK83183.1 glycosyltransferase [Nakamurella sp. PAMC28650]